MESIYKTAEYNREKCRRFYQNRKTRNNEAHLAKSRRNSIEWRLRHPDRVRVKSADRRIKDPEYFREACRKSYLKIKQSIIAVYGGKCLCGVDDQALLTVDHIGGGGNAHRRVTHSMFQAVAKEGCPKDKYRILCWNCICVIN